VAAGQHRDHRRSAQRRAPDHRRLQRISSPTPESTRRAAVSTDPSFADLGSADPRDRERAASELKARACTCAGGQTPRSSLVRRP
jgi:hypothetical protein